MNANIPNRRALLKTGAWSVPVVVAASAAPSVSASVPTPRTPAMESGIFVSTQFNGGYVGYSGNQSTGVIHPTTPQGYFAANPKPESDWNWSDSLNRPTNTAAFVNGEGSFTPVTNAAGSPGSYNSTSGMWYSVPTTAPYTGTGYIPGSTTTIAAGATFVTNLSVTIPAGPNKLWPLQNMTISGKTWNTQLSGNLITQSGANYLKNVQLAGTWTAPKPTITVNADGSATLTGQIIYTTSVANTVTQTGSINYGEVIIMPSDIKVHPAYGWTEFSLTSSIQSATFSYTVPAGSGVTAPATQTITGQTTTSTIHP